MKTILFLNTTDKKLQVAVKSGADVRTYVGEEGAKRHNSALLPVVDSLFSALNVKVQDLTDIICVAGPGSFTGIRSGASFCNAIARSTGATLFAPTSLEIFGEGDRIVTLDCKHGSFYSLIVRGDEKCYLELTEEEVLKTELPRFDVIDDTLNWLIRYGEAMVKADIGKTDLVRPFYLKKSSAEREREQKL